MAGDNLPDEGKFEVDDPEQRQWVLKVNDLALLGGIVSVFVTCESLGDLREPRGKEIDVRAYRRALESPVRVALA